MLTLTQSAVLHFIRDFQARQGNMPTRLEISAHFHWKSGNAGFEHVLAIAAKGYLTVIHGQSRGIAFTQKALELLGQTEAPARAQRDYLALPVVDQSRLGLALQGRAA